MTRLPSITGDRRWIGLLGLTAIALGQAATMVATAFATRDLIGTLRLETGDVPMAALAVLVGAGFAMFSLRSLEGAVAEATGQSFAVSVRRKLFLHMTRTPVSVVADRRAGAMALRYVGDLSALKGWVAKGLARLISAIATIPGAFLVLYLLDPRLAAGAAVPILAVIVAVVWLGTPLGVAHSRLRNRRARMAAELAERLPQGLALRRSGRLKRELRSLASRSSAILNAAVYRAWLSETVRALPDVASGLAGAICLWICITNGLSVEDAVAALTALALMIWPLRRLADVRDRQKAFGVAAQKLDKTLAGPTVSTRKRRAPVGDAPAMRLSATRLSHWGAPVDAVVERGRTLRLVGPSGVGKSRLLTMAAGLEPAVDGKVEVLGLSPSAVPVGRVLYLGRFSPQLKGSLRRECTIGIGRDPTDAEIEAAFRKAGLEAMLSRLGGLSAQVSEGRRNLTSTEVVGISLIRGLLSTPDLALIDADEIGLGADRLELLLDHLATVGAAVVLVSENPPMKAQVRDEIHLHFQATPMTRAA